MVKNLPAMWETWVQSLGWEDSLEEEIILHTVNLLEVQSCGKHFDLVDEEKNSFLYPFKFREWGM